MSIKGTYIQQLKFDGKTYEKGSMIETVRDFNILCYNFPFKILPEAKELPTRDWPGNDGRDVYIPTKIPMAHYEVEVEFIYKGEDDSMREKINNFIKFLYGRNEGAIGARLAIFDEYTGIGRKDVHVQSINDELFYDVDYDDEKCFKFKVKFVVEDPSTEVTPSVVSDVIVGLNFAEP